MSAFRLPLLLRATRYTAQSTPVMRRSYAVAAEQHATATATATPTAGTPTPAAADLPKQAPFDGVPFTAPPRDDTKGQLGQVFLPDMYAIEPFPEEQVIIPGEPDNYASSLDRDRADDFPFLHQPRVVTVSHPATHPSPPSHGSTVDEVVVEATEPGESSENAKVPPEQDVSRHRRRRLDRTLVESQSQSTSSKLESEPESSSSNSSRNGHSRSLNSDERRGLVMLAGILAGGWLLGGLGLRRREKVQVQA